MFPTFQLHGFAEVGTSSVIFFPFLSLPTEPGWRSSWPLLRCANVTAAAPVRRSFNTCLWILKPRSWRSPRHRPQSHLLPCYPPPPSRPPRPHRSVASRHAVAPCGVHCRGEGGVQAAPAAVGDAREEPAVVAAARFVGSWCCHRDRVSQQCNRRCGAWCGRAGGVVVIVAGGRCLCQGGSEGPKAADSCCSWCVSVLCRRPSSSVVSVAGKRSFWCLEFDWLLIVSQLHATATMQ